MENHRNVGVRQHDTPQPRSSPWGSHKIPTTDWGSVHQAKRAIHGLTIASPRWPYWASPSPRPAFQRLRFDSKRRKCSKSHVIHVQGQGLLSFLALRLLSFGWPTSTSRAQRSAGCTRQLLHPAFGTSSDSFPQSSVVRCREQLQQRPSHPEGFAPGSATDPWTRPIHRIHRIHPEFQWFLAQLPRTFGRYGGMELFQSRTKTKVRGGCPPQCTLTLTPVLSYQNAHLWACEPSRRTIYCIDRTESMLQRGLIGQHLCTMAFCSLFWNVRSVRNQATFGIQAVWRFPAVSLSILPYLANPKSRCQT